MNKTELKELRKQQKAEAVTRMKMLNIFPQTIREFRGGKLNRSESGGILFWLDDAQNAAVKEFEKEYNCMVYHAVYNIIEGLGECLSMLYVSAHPEEWGYDKADIRSGCAYAFCHFENGCGYDEIGRIGIKPRWGGLVRTY